MAPGPLVNARILFGQYDISGFSNKLTLAFGNEEKETTTFASQGWKERTTGFKTVSAHVDGMTALGIGLSEDILYNSVDVPDVPFSVVPSTGAVGDLAYAMQGVQGSFEGYGEAGEVAPFSADIWGRGVGVRGVVMADLATPRTATGTGGVQMLGAVGANQRLYALIQVPTATGTTPSLTVKVQSAATAGFASPTDRITFSTLTAAGALWASIPGAVADAYWRVAWTVTGTTPSFNFQAVAAIQ